MTNSEAIEWLKYNKEAIERVAETGRFSDDEDVKQTIESINMAIAALEKQEGKKPVYNGVNCECPFCNTTIETDMKPWYCDICGQRIDWSDEHGTD